MMRKCNGSDWLPGDRFEAVWPDGSRLDGVLRAGAGGRELCVGQILVRQRLGAVKSSRLDLAEVVVTPAPEPEVGSLVAFPGDVQAMRTDRRDTDRAWFASGAWFSWEHLLARYGPPVGDGFADARARWRSAKKKASARATDAPTPASVMGASDDV
jgi:hypothetical protein